MFGKIPDFHPLYAKSIHTLSMRNDEVSRHCQMSPREVK